MRSIHSGAPGWGYTDDKQTILFPSKMVRPSLRVRIVQLNHHTQFRIETSNPVVFEPITTPTRKAKVVLCRSPTQRLWDNVVNRELGPCKSVNRCAV